MRRIGALLPPDGRKELVGATLLLPACFILGRVTGWMGHRKGFDSTEFWPFYNDTWFPGPVFSFRVLFPVLAFLLLWPLLRRWLTKDGLAALFMIIVGAWVYHLALACVRHPPAEAFVWTFRRPQEYWNDVRFVGPGFLARFPEVGLLSQHGATHPPGPTLYLAWVRWLGFQSMTQAELATTPLAALSALPLWGAARRLIGGEAARVATALFLFASSVAAFAVLSMDVLPMFFGAVALYGMAVALDGEWWGGVLLGLGLFAGSMCNYIALTLSLPFAALWLSRPDRRGRAILRGLAVGVATFFLAYAALYTLFGYRAVHVFLQCLAELAKSDDGRRGRLRSLPRGALAYLGALGIPLCGLFLHALGRALGRIRRPESEERRLVWLVLGAALPWLFAVVSGKPKAETEHVFLLFVPTTALAAAAAGQKWFKRPWRWTADLAVPLLVAQSIAIEVFWETYW
jgi:hypothetical protein